MCPVSPSEPPPGGEKECDKLWRYGVLHEEHGRLVEARNCYRELMRWLLDRDQPVPHYLRDRLAQVLVRLRCFPQALTFLQSSRNDLAERGGAYGLSLIQIRQAQVCLAAADPVSASCILAELGDSAGPLGPPEPAQEAELGHRISALRWGNETPQDLALVRAELYYTLARLFGSTGAYLAALAMVDRCDKELSRSAVPRSFLSVEGLSLLRAELHLDCGDLENAERVIASHEPSNGPRWRLLSAWRALLAGKTGEARRLVSVLLGEDLPVSVRLQGIWAQCHQYLLINRLGPAQHLLTTTCAGLSATGAEGHWRRRLQALLQAVAARRSQVARELAIPFVPEQVWEVAEAEPDDEAARESPLALGSEGRVHERFSDEWARLANQLLLSLQEEGLAPAERALSRLQQHTGSCDSPLLQVRTAYYRALVCYQQQRYEETQMLLEPALVTSRAAGWPAEEWRLVTLLGHCCAQLGQRAQHEHCVIAAAALLKKLGADLDEDDRRYFLLNKSSAVDAYISARVRTVGQTGRRGWLAQRRDRLRLYQEISCLTGWGIERHLANPPADGRVIPPEEAHFGYQVEAWVAAQLTLQHYAKVPTGVINSVSSWLLWRIPPQVAVLHFYVAPEQTYVFVLSRRQLQIHSIKVTRVDLDDAVREVLRLIMREGETGVGGPRVELKLAQLGKLLDLHWLQSAIRPSVERLVVIPHDVLVNVPYAALPFGESRLCQRFAISYLPNLFWFMPGYQRAFRPLRAKRYLGVGVQSYPDTALPALPGAAAEAHMVAELLGLDPAQSVVLTDEAVAPANQAEAVRVLAELQRASWAHLACHGEFDRAAPHCSGLIVRGAGAPSRITLADCQTQDLRQLDLAVLASCWSASTAVLPGNEALCLPAAFLRAGTRAVAAALWPVLDEVNGAFIKELVLGTQRWGAARGLAEAQRAFLTSDQPERRRTFTWASYVLYGNG